MERKTYDSSSFRVIGAGFGRTGTASFKKALEILGFGPCYHMFEVIENKRAVQWQQIAEDKSNHSKLLHSELGERGYQSSCDFPSCAFWEEQLAIYPNAKVILTARDAEKWHRSCMEAIFQVMHNHPICPWGVRLAMYFNLLAPSQRTMMDAVIWNRTFGKDWSKENVIKRYNEHNQHVIDTCPKDKLLVFEVSEGWEPLCKFLEVPVPDIPFPHVNEAKEFQQLVLALSAMGYAALGLCVGAGALAVMAGSKYLTGSYLPSSSFLQAGSKR
jgi:hypothetical protein